MAFAPHTQEELKTLKDINLWNSRLEEDNSVTPNKELLKQERINQQQKSR